MVEILAGVILFAGAIFGVFVVLGTILVALDEFVADLKQSWRG